ncbi:DUF2200 domain-containing protein [Candidatus Enterococcus lowellii]|nr:DUF2200 domain-containing protein [Enterococcus sp. DIV2402]MBO0463683.1 DUF2200 domain-containing protein [Enterococcus sp. DIV2402]
MKTNLERVYKMTFASVYPMYITKVEKKGRSKAELDTIIEWLTGFDSTTLQQLIDEQVTFEEFFKRATLNENVSLITGVICGVRIEEIEDPLMKQIRYLDKVVDELAKGKKMEKIMR